MAYTITNRMIDRTKKDSIAVLNLAGKLDGIDPMSKLSPQIEREYKNAVADLQLSLNNLNQQLFGQTTAQIMAEVGA